MLQAEPSWQKGQTHTPQTMDSQGGRAPLCSQFAMKGLVDLVSFSSLGTKQGQVQCRGGKILFGSWFQGFQTMGSWFQC